MQKLILTILWIILTAAHAMAGGAYSYDPHKTVVGMESVHIISDGETLIDLAPQYGVGFNEIANANSEVDPWLPDTGTEIVVPRMWVLPEPGSEIVINLAEMRIYRFFNTPSANLVGTYPIGVAVDGWDTPLGQFRISAKVHKPTWIVPKSIRAENPELPASVPPGDDNPLGEYAMKLGNSRYFVHGTNQPFGIGRRVSHGCIRLYPRDIKELFSIVPMGTRVRLVYEPVKFGTRNGELYVEVHADYLGRVGDLYDHALDALKSLEFADGVDVMKLAEAVNQQSGRPHNVTKKSRRPQ